MVRLAKSETFFTYIIKCSDGTYYTGYAINIEERIKVHNQGNGAKYTRGRKPVKLIWSKKYNNLNSALLEEIRVKKLSRSQKEELIFKKK